MANLSNSHFAFILLLGASPLALAQTNPALADCLQSATNQTCENPEGTTLTGNNGIYDAGTLTLTNDGLIDASGNYGVFARSGVDIVNNAEIRSAFTGIHSDGYAEVTNSGAILGQFYAIYSYGDAEVTNSGTISGDFFGIYSYGNADVTNSGAISSGYNGIYSNGKAEVTNSGTISSGYNGIYSYGNADVTNSGTISANYFGIYSYGNAEATNSGTISGGYNGFYSNGNAGVTNSGTISGGYYGIRSDGDAAATNSGTISGGYYGIYSNGNAGVTNSGTITGDYIGFLSIGKAEVTNSGTISGRGTGIAVYGDNGTINNAGTISSKINAIYYRRGTTGHVLNIAPTAKFDGSIAWNYDIGNTINFGSGNYDLSVEEFLSNANTITLTSPNQLLITSDLNTTGTGTLHVVNAAPAGQGAAALGDYVRASSSAVMDVLSEDVDRSTVTVQPVSEQSTDKAEIVDQDGNLFWVRGLAGAGQLAGSDGNKSNYGGLAIGVDKANGDLRIGAAVGFGFTDADANDDSISENAKVFSAALYGQKQTGNWMADIVLGGGFLGNTSARASVAGETAVGSYTGVFIAPEAALSYRHHVSTDWSITPSVQLRYLGISYESYAETGSPQTFAYAAHNTGALEERAELRLAHTKTNEQGFKTATTLQAAVFGIQRLGGGEIEANYQGFGFNMAESETAARVGASLGLGFDWQVSAQTYAFAAADGSLMSDGSVSVAGKFGVKLAF